MVRDDEAAWDEAADRKAKSGPLIPCPNCKVEYKLNEAVLRRAFNTTADDKCSLCLDEMKTEWGFLKCGHSFHMCCFDEHKDHIKADFMYKDNGATPTLAPPQKTQPTTTHHPLLTTHHPQLARLAVHLFVHSTDQLAAFVCRYVRNEFRVHLMRIHVKKVNKDAVAESVNPDVDMERDDEA